MAVVAFSRNFQFHRRDPMTSRTRNRILRCQILFQVTKINAEVYNFINNEMQRGKIVCRNTIESFVNKQDWTLNGKIFEFTFEWFERFSELYNIYPVKGVSIRD